MQITSGKEIASTSEFLQYNSFSGGIFDDNLPIQLENNRFRITVNNLLPEVCGLIKNSIGINTTIRKVVCSTEQIGTGVFWFNSDLNPNDPQGDLCDVSNNIYCDYGQLCTTSGNIAGECINQQKKIGNVLQMRIALISPIHFAKYHLLAITQKMCVLLFKEVVNPYLKLSFSQTMISKMKMKQ